MTDDEFLADVTQQNCYDITREEFERLVKLARIGASVKTDHVMVPRIALGSLVRGIEEGSDPLSAGNTRMRQHFNAVIACLAPIFPQPEPTPKDTPWPKMN